jgi:hypothetical protein
VAVNPKGDKNVMAPLAFAQMQVVAQAMDHEWLFWDSNDFMKRLGLAQ